MPTKSRENLLLEKESSTNKGVTLIEMLAAVAIFSIIVGAISGIFISAIRAQRRVLATQELLDQTSYVLEYMGRALRMAIKDDIDSGGVVKNCLTGDKVNYETISNGIKFRNYHNECQTFYLDSNRLKESRNTVENYLTSEKITVQKFKINLSGETQTDTIQPRVTFFLEALGRGATGEQPKIQIQTSISQRNLDVSQ
jgi:prepilin-type N-terminal cleavage/methylation domain-containing protein